MSKRNSPDRPATGAARTPRRHWLIVAVLMSLGAAPGAAGSSVDLIPTTAVVGVVPGDIVAFDIVLDFSDEPTLGGGFDLTFDESQLGLVGFTVQVSLGDPQYGRPPDYVPGSGLLESWAVGDFSGITGGYVGSVDFVVLPGATSSVVALGPTMGIGGPWVSAVDFICCLDPEYGQVTVTAVPLPAALWLLVGALSMLRVAASPRPDGD